MELSTWVPFSLVSGMWPSPTSGGFQRLLKDTFSFRQEFCHHALPNHSQALSEMRTSAGFEKSYHCLRW